MVAENAGQVGARGKEIEKVLSSQVRHYQKNSEQLSQNARQKHFWHLFLPFQANKRFKSISQNMNASRCVLAARGGHF